MRRPLQIHRRVVLAALTLGATAALTLGATVALTLGAALAGCVRDKPIAPYPVSLPPPATDAAFGPGDTFEVRVFGEEDLSAPYQVAPDGSIHFPLIGVVAVAGKTAPQVEDEIQTRLADGYLRNPQVSVLPKEYRSKKISVFGQVRQPGTFPYVDNMSVVEAVSLAGGFTAMAKKNAVRVSRTADGGRAKHIIVAVEDIGRGKAPNFILRPGDVVFVPERVF